MIRIGTRHILPSTRSAMNVKLHKRGISVQRPVPPPPPTNEASGLSLPNGRGRTIVIGTLLVSSGFGLFFVYLQRRQTKKEQKDLIAPGHVPTWQYIMKQAGQPAHDPGTPHGDSHDQGLPTATSKEG